jgi:hypothetical protein
MAANVFSARDVMVGNNFNFTVLHGKGKKEYVGFCAFLVQTIK